MNAWYSDASVVSKQASPVERYAYAVSMAEECGMWLTFFSLYVARDCAGCGRRRHACYHIFAHQRPFGFANGS